jgi:predicted permease
MRLAIFRMLLWAYPPQFRSEYGNEMLWAFRDEMAVARTLPRQAGIWTRAIKDLLVIAPKEHYLVILQDIRYALRSFAASPGYAAVVILSLALGIGANTAIFSLMNSVMLSQLPVRDAGQLVMLSDPQSYGISVGSQTGERGLLTYAEFEQLRSQAEGFEGMTATQSNLETADVRIDGSGQAEKARMRMVSHEYFSVLGVPLAIGRSFESERDPVVVLNHSFWKRRFGADPGVIGKPLVLRKATLTIAGVAPAGFFGETVGQQPDFWAPLGLQPQILPGRDWLHDVGDEKVMWLQVFGRLKPGASMAQAEAKANAVFRNGLETLYGGVMSAEALKGYLDQKLKLRPASGGATIARSQFGDPILLLQAVAGIVLLIACANLANLMLARGAVRQREIALRLSLGAGRGRLIQQLLTESLMLAMAGGAAALAVAYGAQRLLVQWMSQTDVDFSVDFQMDFKLLGFAFALSLAAAVIFGLLPALNITGSMDAAASLKEQGRGTIGSGGRMRIGRFLVACQIALSLPLLLGAGLLARTLYHLQQLDLGYSREKLLLVRTDFQTAGYASERRDPLAREILEKIRRLPGVAAATYSENGLFAGRDSADEIAVEGYTRKGGNDEGSRWDQVGPDYFSTLGVPILQGREIRESDRASGLKVCVINEAFAKKFFDKRNPIGMHITTIYGDKRRVHEIVGVARDHRTHRLRGDTPHRNFVPFSQPLGEADGMIFEVRTHGPAAAMVEPLRRLIASVDSNIPVPSINTVDERLDRRLSQERILARLTLTLSLAALALAAIGLYGVLSYGVAWRRAEIGVRIALGAQPGEVVWMILRQSGTLVIGGLVAGVALSLGVGKILESQVFGLSPQDPATFAVSIAVLLVVAMGAAALPAWRASQVDPMVALRQE